MSEIILYQNCVRLLDAALDYFFFFKNLFLQKQFKYALNIGFAQIRGAFLWIFIGKKCPFTSLQRLPSICKITPGHGLLFISMILYV